MSATSVVEDGASSPTFEDIARRAYEIFEARGGTYGDPVSDWLQAEAELKQSPSPD